MEDNTINDWVMERSVVGEDCLLRSAHPFLRQLYIYWQNLPRLNGAILPARQQIDPVIIGNILPWVWLADVVRQPFRFRYRLIGTAHAEAIGRNVTGEWFDDVSPEFPQSRSYEDLITLVERGVPSYRCGATVMPLVKKGFERRERLALPLSDDGRYVDTVLGVTIYQGVRIPYWAMDAFRGAPG